MRQIRRFKSSKDLCPPLYKQHTIYQQTKAKANFKEFQNIKGLVPAALQTNNSPTNKTKNRDFPRRVKLAHETANRKLRVKQKRAQHCLGDCLRECNVRPRGRRAGRGRLGSWFATLHVDSVVEVFVLLLVFRPSILARREEGGGGMEKKECD